jgi:transposase InsO family protein
MISFIDEHRSVFGVEPICRLLPIAPSTYYENVAKRLDVDRLSVRARSDIGMKIEIRRVFEQNFRVYGVRKVWRQLQREGVNAARCTVARLMRSMSLQGVIRGKPIRTTFSDKSAPSRLTGLTASSKPLHLTGCGFGLHLCRHPAGFCLRGLCHRRLRSSHRWLAGEPDGTCKLCPRCT